MSAPSLLIESLVLDPRKSGAKSGTTAMQSPENAVVADRKRVCNPDHYNPTVREVNIPKLANGSCGFDLSRSKWDPYPWVSGIDKDSTAEQTGLRVGDCVLEVNGEDVLGLRIAEVAQLVRAKAENVTLLLWTTGMDPTCSPESLCCGPMPINLDRLSSCVQSILAALECPICLDTIPPPAIQCTNGHLVCVACRARAEKCPICRQRYSGGRSLIAEQVYNTITDAFKLRENEGKLRERLFGAQCRKTVSNAETLKTVQSHTHKFLAKIMGKATSLDSLNKSTTNLPGHREETTKQLSLSVNEIFRPNSSAPTSRSTSPHRLIPDLGSQTFLGTRRPQSQNVSAESLNDITDNHVRLEIPTGTINQHFCCPSGDSCDQKMKGHQIERHITDFHKVAVITIGQPAAVVDLPPRTPLADGSLVLRLDDHHFWVKVSLSEDQSEYFVACLVQGGATEAGRYFLELTIGQANAEKILSKEIVSRSAVYSLAQHSWMDLVGTREGIVLTRDSIESTFGVGQVILLTVAIKRL